VKPPDFYLASTETSLFAEPRRCWRVKRLTTTTRRDLLLVKVDPPLRARDLGLDRAENLDLFVLATRFKDSSLFPITTWPVYVHVARVLVENIADRDTLKNGEYESIAWAELYRTVEDALLKRM
jgi:hypothetical protein